MALGKPVIATAYSGNLDFATAANSCQVSYRLRQITSEDHLYNEGMAEVYEIGATWADPDVDQAARWMQLLAADPVLRRRIGEAARTTIRSGYTAGAAVQAVAKRLVDIGSRFGASGAGRRNAP
jgi:glycosyltransferase involved in cell wall biosynthesis